MYHLLPIDLNFRVNEELNDKKCTTFLSFEKKGSETIRRIIHVECFGHFKLILKKKERSIVTKIKI